MRMHHLKLLPCGMSHPMFQRSLLLPSSWEAAGSSELMVHLDCMVTSQMTAMFKVTVSVI
jgi:hypothetical protein